MTTEPKRCELCSMPMTSKTARTCSLLCRNKLNSQTMKRLRAEDLARRAAQNAPPAEPVADPAVRTPAAEISVLAERDESETRQRVTLRASSTPSRVLRASPFPKPDWPASRFQTLEEEIALNRKLLRVVLTKNLRAKASEIAADIRRMRAEQIRLTDSGRVGRSC